MTIDQKDTTPLVSFDTIKLESGLCTSGCTPAWKMEEEWLPLAKPPRWLALASRCSDALRSFDLTHGRPLSV